MKPNLSAAVFLLAGLLLVVPTLAAAGEGTDRKGIDITVYNGDIGLVKEIRTLKLKKGLNQVAVTDVPSKIIPETVHFRSMDDPKAVVLEQNYEYDIVGTRKLLEKYIDQPITAVTQDGSTHSGRLLSGASDVILQRQDGGVTVLKYDRLRQFSFPSLPEGLITRPTLKWLVRTAKGGSQQVELAYLTSGISWESNYVLVLARDNRSLSLDGWITLKNRSGTSFKQARLKLVAGDVHRVSRSGPPRRIMKGRMMMVEAADNQVEHREFSEYHLYEVPRPVTVNNNQTKQIQFLSVRGVPTERIFVFDGRNTPVTRTDSGAMKGKVQVKIRFQTGEKGINAQLPKGIIRMYQPDADGSPLFIGEDFLDHTPKGEKVTLTVGQAFDLVGERKHLGTKRLSNEVWRESYEIVLRNHKDEDVKVHVVEHLMAWANWDILKASPGNYIKLNSGTIEWIVPVPAHGQAKVTYTVEYSR